MPYFKWRGVNIIGEDKKGTLLAPSKQVLDRLLFDRGIALLSSQKIKKKTFLFSQRLTTTMQAQFFDELARLLSAGMLLPEALVIIRDQAIGNKMPILIEKIYDSVNAGKTLFYALHKASPLFSELTLQMVDAGHRSGNLAHSISLVAQQLSMRDQFMRQLRTALLMPTLTIVFFAMVAFFLFVFIIPQFADLFTMFNATLPPLTQVLINISKFVTSRSFVWSFGAFICLSTVMYLLFTKSVCKAWWARTSLLTPFYGRILRDLVVMRIARSIGLLLQNGISLVDALGIACNAEGDVYVQNCLQKVVFFVRSGSTLSSSLAFFENLFPIEVISLVQVGERSASLASAFIAIADRYQEHIQRRLTRFTMLVQPIAIIVLGCLIGLLVVAIYLPIIHLSTAIS
jgi:type II secretory pathway component PulF